MFPSCEIFSVSSKLLDFFCLLEDSIVAPSSNVFIIYGVMGGQIGCVNFLSWRGSVRANGFLLLGLNVMLILLRELVGFVGRVLMLLLHWLYLVFWLALSNCLWRFTLCCRRPSPHRQYPLNI
jgi:hypothetical protein